MPKPNQELSEWIDIIDDADFISMGVGELLEIAAQKFPNTEALIYSHQPDIKNIRWTYKDLNEMSTNLARGFLLLALVRRYFAVGAQIIQSGY